MIYQKHSKNSYQFFSNSSKKREESTLPISFYPDTKPDKDKKRILEVNIPDEHRFKNPQQNIHNQIQQYIEKIIGSSPRAKQVKDPGWALLLLQLWYKSQGRRFNPWPRKFHMQWVQPKNKQGYTPWLSAIYSRDGSTSTHPSLWYTTLTKWRMKIIWSSQ